MKVDVKKDQDSRCTVELTIESEKVETLYSRYLNEAARNVNIHGFRKGKAPIKLVENYINKDLIMSEVFKELAPSSIQQALEQEMLYPINEPSMEMVQFERGKDFILKTTFEVKPEIEIDGFEGLELTQEKTEVTEEDVSKTIAMMQENAAQAKDVEEDRGLRAGDIALVDFDSFEDGKPLENGTARHYLMELKEDAFIPGFITHLQDAKKGDERKFQATFPADYASELRGKTVDFEFKIHGIKEKVLSPIDDDFAKEVSQFQTLQELKDDLKAKLEKRADDQARQGAEEKISQILVDKVTIPIPPSLIAYEQDMLLDDFRRNFASQGIDFDKYLAHQQKNSDSFLETLKPQAERMARIELALDTIGKKADITITDEEIDEKLKEIAGELKQDFNKFKATVQKEGRISGLRYAMQKKKVMAFLIDKARITYVAPEQKEPETVEAGK